MRAIGIIRSDYTALFRGFRPVGTIVHQRLRSALVDLERTTGWARPDGAAVNDPGRPRAWSALRNELQRLNLSGEEFPVLGRSVGADHDQAARVTAIGLLDAEPAALPRVLQAVVTLDGLAAAVCALDGMAIVLPIAAPDSLTAPPIEPEGWRRSRRTHWRTPLYFLDETPAILLGAIDLAPWDGFADYLLARQIVAIEEPARRGLALQIMGVGRVVGALHLPPVHVDPFGRLFHVGDHRDPIAFVAVRDQAVEADGASIEHWICVPPHMATAREAVAWTFGMSEQEYQPLRET